MPTSPGLVVGLAFNEGAGGVAHDISGYGNHGTLSGATWVAGGRYGKALSFNGTSSWVTIPNSLSIGALATVTLEAWVYPTSAINGWRDVIMKERAGGAAFYLCANNADSMQSAGGIDSGSEQVVRGGTVLTTNVWTHLAMTYDGKAERLYVNGVQVSMTAATGNPISSTYALRIGGDSIWGEFFNGYIDEVRVYNRAVAAAQIVTDMNTPLRGVAP